MPASKTLSMTWLPLLAFACNLLADDVPAPDGQSTKPGHSTHADAFNEGPRQAAYLMNGMGNVHWEISTKNPMAQRFFDQGITQLHGFWYFEAERSFRQAAAFDPDCAILYWGMARANIENPSRSKGFSEQALKAIAKAPDKEKRLIEAWNKRVKDTKKNWPKTTIRNPKPTPKRKPRPKKKSVKMTRTKKTNRIA